MSVRYRPDKQTCGWIRWLAVGCGMPAADVCFVLELPDPLPSHFARCLKPSGRGAPRPTRPQPDRRQGRRPPLTARCKTARKIRRLTELGYTASRVATLLGLPAARVARLLRGTHRFGPLASPWEDCSVRTEREEWADARRRAAHPGSTPAASQALAEVLATVTELAIVPAPASPWNGPVALHHSGPRAMTDGQIAEARALLLNGESWYSVARRLGVARNTLYRHVRDMPRRRRPRAQKVGVARDTICHALARGGPDPV